MNRSDAIEVCLESTTGQFETGGKWDKLTNNFDGFGPSAGILQFSWGAGSLQNIIKGFDLSKYFTQEQARQLGMRMNLDSVESQRTWATQTIFDAEKHFKPEWKPGWIALAQSQEFKDAQLKGVEKYADKADDLVKWAGINTLRAFALFFDVAVQNGSIKDEVRKLAEQKRSQVRPVPANKTWMKLIIDTRLDTVRPDYRDDVRRRKYAIIEGGGVVHKNVYNFDSLNLEQEYEPA